MKEQVKVLYFVDRMLRGGIQSLIIDWISRFDKDKISVDVLLLDDGKKYELEDTLKDMGCNVYKLNNIWVRTPVDFIRESKALKSFFKEHHNYKVVHLHSSSKNYMVLKYAKKYGIPVRIAHSHNIDFQTKNKIKKFAGVIFKIPLKIYATHYFACAEVAGKWLFGERQVRKGNVKVIHNAIDYKKFKLNNDIRNNIRKDLSIQDNNIIIGNVGRFTNQKNHSFLIDIFYEIYKINNKAILMLVGTGEKEDEIKNKVRKLKLEKNVLFMGFRKNVNELMWAMDVFVMPSLYEGLPVVGIEAQATGLPCFMSKDVITSEVKITDSLKFISLKKTAKEWAEIILNSDLKRRNTETEFKNAKYFIEDTAKELQDFYLNV